MLHASPSLIPFVLDQCYEKINYSLMGKPFKNLKSNHCSFGYYRVPERNSWHLKNRDLPDEDGTLAVQVLDAMSIFLQSPSGVTGLQNSPILDLCMNQVDYQSRL